MYNRGSFILRKQTIPERREQSREYELEPHIYLMKYLRTFYHSLPCIIEKDGRNHPEANFETGEVYLVI